MTDNGLNHVYPHDSRDLRIPHISDIRDLVEVMRVLHFRVACSESPSISLSGGLGGNVYPVTRKALTDLIGVAYADLTETDIAEVYELWAENNESIAYNVKYLMNRKTEEADEQADWHNSVDRPKSDEVTYTEVLDATRARLAALGILPVAEQHRAMREAEEASKKRTLPATWMEAALRDELDETSQKRPMLDKKGDMGFSDNSYM